MQSISAFRNLLLALVLGGAPFVSFGQVAVGVGVSIDVAPPPLPAYDQPPCPGDDYIWVPGYWAYDDDGYYWVSGYWAEAPEIGFLWTPGYWTFSDGFYVWKAGYWGRDVGFYGGINYGFGYGGIGYYGGRWEGNTFYYNTAVTNVNTAVVHNTYVQRTNRVITTSRASFNGPGGVTARPTAEQRVAMHQRHIQATSAQMAHQRVAAKTGKRVATVNRGHPSKTTLNKTAVNKTAVRNTAAANVGRRSTVNTGRSTTARVNNKATKTTATKTTANVRTRSRTGRSSSTRTGAIEQTTRQERTVKRTERTPVAQTHKTVNNQASNSHRTVVTRHEAPVRRNQITQTTHPNNPVAYEHRAPVQRVAAQARRISTPEQRGQPQQSQKKKQQNQKNK